MRSVSEANQERQKVMALLDAKTDELIKFLQSGKTNIESDIAEKQKQIEIIRAEIRVHEWYRENSRPSEMSYNQRKFK